MKSTDLRLIQGHYPLKMAFGPLEVVAAPESLKPFPIDARAFEEDTFLVLSADRKIRDSKKPLMHIMTELIEMRPEIPGSILVKGRTPYRLLAIVHDLNQVPSWREEWVQKALDNILREAEIRKLGSIAIPLLGTLHGSLEKPRFVDLLWDAVTRFTPHYLKRLWVVVPKGTDKTIFERFFSTPQS
jgi:hypothetical protein